MIESIKVSVSPDVLRAGKPVTIEATIVGDTSEVKRVVATVPEYDLTETLSHVADNVYRLNITVPWEAPSGTYNVEVYAQGAQWNILHKTYVTVNVA